MNIYGAKKRHCSNLVVDYLHLFCRNASNRSVLVGASLGRVRMVNGCGASHSTLLMRNQGALTAAAVMPARSAAPLNLRPKVPRLHATWSAGSPLSQWPPASVGCPSVARTAASVAQTDGRRGFISGWQGWTATKKGAVHPTKGTGGKARRCVHLHLLSVNPGVARYKPFMCV